MTNDEIELRLEKEFKEHLNLRYPNLDMKHYALAVDSFQKGLMLGKAMIFNKVSDIKVALFYDGSTGEE